MAKSPANIAAGCAAIVAAMTITTIAEARDASRGAQSYQTPAAAIPNPYAPAASQSSNSANRAGDAYATGFAIGLGTALINKQREDDAKQLREQSAPRK